MSQHGGADINAFDSGNLITIVCERTMMPTRIRDLPAHQAVFGSPFSTSRLEPCSICDASHRKYA
ncbi:unnamed protein product [Periconia digitata]|uniref:Uncharacterized protein n=1 Tax=Periconia digitata TaxID=1303443 RepID=A0A9W4ULD2_9PLEO|nr:unnamed protein product [Periconia digitata]